MDDDQTSTSNLATPTVTDSSPPTSSDSYSPPDQTTVSAPEPTDTSQDTDAQTSSDSSAATDQPAIGGLGAPPPLDNSLPPAKTGTSSSDVDISPITSEPAISSDNSGLQDIKSHALGQLTPLVKNLDQTPEQRFKTTMMLIQASDNQGLIKDAYEAAQQITDEKLKAQALLDIVNEINYFSQPPA